MKFVLAILFYLVAALVLAVGMLLTFKGNFWVLIAGVAGYLLMLGVIGCLPKESHH